MIEPGSIPAALVGGALIGTAAVLMLGLNGRILGVSGIASSAISPRSDGRLNNILFLAGMLIGGAVLTAALPASMPGAITENYGWLALAGLLVGFGTRLGGGCTSGHGVCGMSRLSPRSLIATLTFMAAGIVAVFLIRHVFAGTA
ncbi:MAG: YeeE/YedE family protein [Gammaproteobacteria bacterium]